MKIAMISDLHFNMWRKNNSFFSYLIDFFSYLTEEINKNKIEYLFIAGDLFHTKSVVSAEMLLNTTNIFRMLNKQCPKLKRIFIVPGNHDIYLRKDVEWNILHIYQEFPKVEVFHSINFYDIDDIRFWFLPYYRDAKQYKKILNEIDTSIKKRNILISHIGVDSFFMLKTEDISIEEQNSFLKPNKFKKFDFVFLGHFHSYQSKGNITYLSSPIQSRHGDEFGSHGFVIFDTQKFNFEFMENKFTPRFLTRELNMNSLKELLSVSGENKFVRLTLKEHIPSSKLSIIIDRLKKKNYSVEIQFLLPGNMFYDEAIAEIKNWDELVFNSVEDLFKKFLDTTDTELNKNKLFEFITTLTIENNI